MSVKGNKLRKYLSKDIPKVMSLVSVSKDKPLSIRERGGNMPDLNGWKQVGYFGSYGIFAKDEFRRLVDITTGKVAIEYSVPGEISSAKNWV